MEERAPHMGAALEAIGEKNRRALEERSFRLLDHEGAIHCEGNIG